MPGKRQDEPFSREGAEMQHVGPDVTDEAQSGGQRDAAGLIYL